MALRAPPRMPPRIPERSPGVRPGEAAEEDVGGLVPPSPLLANLSIWLQTSKASINAGTLSIPDQSGNHNDASQAATVWTLVPASSGVPAHIAYAGVGNSAITGTLTSPLPATTSYTLYALRNNPSTSTRGTTFKNGTNAVRLWHDNFGAPGRTGLQQAAGILSVADNDVGWLVESATYAYDPTTPLTTLYHSNVSIGSQALADTGGMTLSYQFGGVDFTGGETARDIAELLLYWGIAHSAPQRAAVNAYLLSTIPA